MDIKLLLFSACPNGEPARALLDEVLREEGVQDPIRVVEIETPEAACRERSLGSPSILINGFDIEQARRGDLPSHGCRLYQTETGTSGVPAREMIRGAVRRARGPMLKVLFLCTGNSCRSQMAEGWARHLNGDVIEPFSAGIEKHGLNPHAVKVMAEAGVDISSHSSKTLEDLNDQPLDYVVTVCGHAHETCPMFPGNAKVVHIGFDDPPKLAAAETDPQKALSHYRRVRDEIKLFVETLPGSLNEHS